MADSIARLRRANTKLRHVEDRRYEQRWAYLTRQLALARGAERRRWIYYMAMLRIEQCTSTVDATVRPRVWWGS